MDEEKYYCDMYYNYGDEDAKSKLIKANLRLVLSIVKRYIGRGLAFEDLVQEGNLGLIKGIETFKLSKGCKISTHIFWPIRSAILRALSNKNRNIRLPVYKQSELYQYKLARNRYILLYGEIDYEDLAQYMKISLEKVLENERLLGDTLSLFFECGNSEDELYTLIEDENAINPEDAGVELSLKLVIQDILNSLNEYERNVIMLRYGFYDGIPKTLRETALAMYELNSNDKIVTVESIRQVESRASKKIKKPNNIRKLEGF